MTQSATSQGMQLDVRQLRVTVGDKCLLSDVTFTAFSGELTGILGLSGSGKSTMLNAISGMQPCDGGRMFLGGRALEPGVASRARIGYCTQDSTIHPSLRLEQALWYAGLLRAGPGVNADELHARLDRVLESVDLTDRRRSRIVTLSGGERRRANIGAELMADPPLLLLDEPTAGLDPALETQMMRLFRGMADEGRTLLVTTHLMANMRLLDVVIILGDGHLCFFGPTEDVLGFFGCARFEEVFDAIRDTPGREWAARLQRSPWWSEYCVQRYRKPGDGRVVLLPSDADARPPSPADDDDLDIALDSAAVEPPPPPPVAADANDDDLDIALEAPPAQGQAAPAPAPEPDANDDDLEITLEMGEEAPTAAPDAPTAPPAPPATAACIACGAQMSATAPSCDHCGTPQVTCPHCKARADGRDRFCLTCGGALPRGGA